MGDEGAGVGVMRVREEGEEGWEEGEEGPGREGEEGPGGGRGEKKGDGEKRGKICVRDARAAPRREEGDKGWEGEVRGWEGEKPTPLCTPSSIVEFPHLQRGEHSHLSLGGDFAI